MEIANCEHQEVAAIDTISEQAEASCFICGQARRYIEGDDHSIVITKLGFINGSLVLPPPGTRFEITSAETQLVQKGWDIRNALEGNRQVKGAPISKKTEKVIEPEPVPELQAEKADPPPAVGDTVARGIYWQKHQEEILADLPVMTIKNLIKKWQFKDKNEWYKLRLRWKGEHVKMPDLRHRDNVKLKTIGQPEPEPVAAPEEKQETKTPKPAVMPKGYKEPQPKAGEFCILITEEDLAKMDDDDYRLQWVLLGRIIRNRMS